MCQSPKVALGSEPNGVVVVATDWPEAAAGRETVAAGDPKCVGLRSTRKEGEKEIVQESELCSSIATTPSVSSAETTDLPRGKCSWAKGEEDMLQQQRRRWRRQ
jgi:hypothetical protein